MCAAKISVLVIENHPLMREALCAAIATEPGLAVAAQAASGAEALSMAACVNPDIILIALEKSGQGNMDALISMRQAHPAIPILVLTTNELPEQEQAALACGARVVLSKASSRAELLSTLRSMGRKAARK